MSALLVPNKVGILPKVESLGIFGFRRAQSAARFMMGKLVHQASTIGGGREQCWRPASHCSPVKSEAAHPVSVGTIAVNRDRRIDFLTERLSESTLIRLSPLGGAAAVAPGMINAGSWHTPHTYQRQSLSNLIPTFAALPRRNFVQVYGDDISAL